MILDTRWLPALAVVLGAWGLWLAWNNGKNGRGPYDDGLGPMRGILFAVMVSGVACLVVRLLLSWS